MVKWQPGMGMEYETGTRRLTRVSVDPTNLPVIADRRYAYDEVGNVIAASEYADPATADDFECYRYDGHRRLTNAWTRTATGSCADTPTLAGLGGPAPYWHSYDPYTGLFMSVDPINDVTDLQSLNAYSYGRNNPATFSDPSGLMNADYEGYLGGGSPYAHEAGMQAYERYVRDHPLEASGGPSKVTRAANKSTFSTRSGKEKVRNAGAGMATGTFGVLTLATAGPFGAGAMMFGWDPAMPMRDLFAQHGVNTRAGEFQIAEDLGPPIPVAGAAGLSAKLGVNVASVASPGISTGESMPRLRG
ncbi:RHS repeat-associated core domain-containing protein [Tenggerimyces flavus]|uniref:RHS repeat-associated core domain-containing protein n=1 Tax=Tenggerimyces flavus TaxID=1708749 RepID=A0ABV7YCC5_9ACTN|nr:RHS repeat-associated core domain-containing protein [Tenggerimyces flavus]MBM7789145.1 hypothetical protein [Tenggerimyces flavus]